MFYVGQKVVCVDNESYEQELAVGAIYTIRWLGTLDGVARGLNLFHNGRPMDLTAGRLRLHEVSVENETSGGMILRDWPMLLCQFRPVTDISDLQSIVAEVKRGKPRKIASDQFDRERAPQARDVAPDHRPAAASLPAAPVSPSPAVEPPASFLDTARLSSPRGETPELRSLG